MIDLMCFQDLMRGSKDKARILYAPVEEIGDGDRLLHACRILIAFVSSIFSPPCTSLIIKMKQYYIISLNLNVNFIRWNLLKFLEPS